MPKVNPFTKTTIENMPRLLGQLNRNPSSPNYGSFDRSFWHYRTNDISCARYQEATLTLTLLYFHQFSGNFYYQDQIVREWLEAALKFATKIQNSNGSFSEWFVNEHSFVCTAFVTEALSEVLLEFQTHGKNLACRNEVLDGLSRAGQWLLKRQESWVMNQTSGAAAALANLWKLTGDDHFKEGAKKKADFIINNQYEGGWWSEYGGPDIGYLSLMIDYLIKYHERTKDNDIEPSIDRAVEFLTSFMHPNLTIGGEYGSRNTEYLIPSGFVNWAQRNKHYSLICQFAYWSLRKKRGISPSSLDDRYLCYILSNWLQAGLDWQSMHLKPIDSSVLKDQLNALSTSIFHEQAGIVVIREKSTIFILNLHKGGIFRIYMDGRHYLDSGLEVVTPSETLLFSSVLDKENQFQISKQKFLVQGQLKRLKEPVMKTPITIAFKSFMLLVGRLSWFQSAIRYLLRINLIAGVKRTRFSFTRKFLFYGGNLQVEDRALIPRGSRILVGTKSSYTFIPSSKYFEVQELGKYRISLSEERDYRDDEWVCIRNFELQELSVLSSSQHCHQRPPSFSDKQ
jgi:hypothetical protein